MSFNCIIQYTYTWILSLTHAEKFMKIDNPAPEIVKDISEN